MSDSIQSIAPVSSSQAAGAPVQGSSPSTAPPATGQKDSVNVSEEAQEEANSTYSVASGDTLSGIAQTYGLSLSALEADNPQITNPDHIYPGESIRLGATPPSASQPPAPSSLSGLVNQAWQTGRKYGLDPRLFVGQIQQESAFNPSQDYFDVTGPAVGLGSIHPDNFPSFDVNRALHGNRGGPDTQYQLDYIASQDAANVSRYGSMTAALETWNSGGPNSWDAYYVTDVQQRADELQQEGLMPSA